VNKLIEKTQKKEDFEEEVELYEKIEEKVENIDKMYSATRAELCKPKIIDITEKGYDYNQIMKTQYNKTTDLRLGYLKDIDNLISNFFQDGISENCFKDAIDDDIAKTIQYFGETKLLVGKISVRNTKENSDKAKKDDSNKEAKLASQVLPLYLSEKALKFLNKSFMC